jgi:hypothetical protein
MKKNSIPRFHLYSFSTTVFADQSAGKDVRRLNIFVIVERDVFYRQAGLKGILPHSVCMMVLMFAFWKNNVSLKQKKGGGNFP